MRHDNMSLLGFLNQLEQQLDLVKQRYAQYLRHGNRFQDAQEIKTLNENILSLITRHSSLLPDEHSVNIAALKKHLNVWCHLWDIHYEKMNPSSEDPFIFENTETFPRDAVEKILAYHQTLKH